jgi:hypothetical protein
MARTALWAPAHRVLQRSAPGQLAPGNAPAAAPSLDYLGPAFQDHRLPWNQANSATGAQGLGWYGVEVLTCDQVPATAASNNIAVAANAVSGTPMTLVSASGAGVTVVPTGGQLWFPFLNTIPAGAVVLDTVQSLVRFGPSLGDNTGFYDPLHSLQRAVTILGVTGGAGGNFLITGFDYYGATQTQLLTVGAGAVSATTTKTFKGIISVTPQFADAHNYSVGTADVFGLHFAADRFSYVEIFWNNVSQLVATFTAADATSPATNLTGDVRGTFTPGSASNGTIRLQMVTAPSLARANAGTIFGVTPV